VEIGVVIAVEIGVVIAVEIGVAIAIILMGGEMEKEILMIEYVVGRPSVEEDAIEMTSVVLFVTVLLIEVGIVEVLQCVVVGVLQCVVVGVLQCVVTTVDAAVHEVVHHR